MADYGAADLDLNITRDLSAFLSPLRLEDLPDETVHAARRGVLDWVGCALSGSDHPTITKLLSVLEEVGGKPKATVFGRNLKLGVLDAPIANGQMGHMLDFDDTHMAETIAGEPILERRRVWFGEWVECPVYRREAMPPGFTVTGPAVVEEAGGTSVVPPLWRCEIASDGALVCARNS